MLLVRAHCFQEPANALWAGGGGSVWTRHPRPLWSHPGVQTIQGWWFKRCQDHMWWILASLWANYEGGRGTATSSSWRTRKGTHLKFQQLQPLLDWWYLLLQLVDQGCADKQREIDEQQHEIDEQQREIDERDRELDERDRQIAKVCIFSSRDLFWLMEVSALDFRCKPNLIYSRPNLQFERYGRVTIAIILTLSMQHPHLLHFFLSVSSQGLEHQSLMGTLASTLVCM